VTGGVGLAVQRSSAASVGLWKKKRWRRKYIKAMKPNKLEDEYVWVQEMQQRMARLAKEQQAKSEAEKQRLKEAHWMHCPKCGQKLATETCGPVEIDVCPSCKGVWLDMGELGTIVETAGQGSFFHKCLRIIRKNRPPSPHLSPHLAAKPKSNRPD
jgi:uncharacterized protein